MWVLERPSWCWLRITLLISGALSLWAPVAHAEPLVGLAKAAEPAVYLGDRVFSVRFVLLVENMGGVRLNKLRVQDDLQASFGDAVAWFEVEPGSLASDKLAVNHGYDGVTDIELLDTYQRLAVGKSATISFTVRFGVTQNRGTLFNSARTESKECVPDVSTNGPDPDPNHDGWPDEREPTPISYEIPARPLVGVAKGAGPTQYLGERTFSNTIEVVIENFGNVALKDLQLLDDLQSVFADAVLDFEVDSLVGEHVSVNPEFDGIDDKQLLLPGNRLEIGARAMVRFNLLYRPIASTGKFENQIVGSCLGCPDDLSKDGSDPDPNGDGDPREEKPTPLKYELPPDAGPRLGLAKAASFGRVVEGAVRETEITLRLRNFGDTTASNLALEDPLSETFAQAMPFNVVPGSLRSSDLTIAPDFNGATQKQLLVAGQNLAPDDEAMVQFRVQFTVTTQTGDLFNTAVVAAEQAARDESTDGSDADPDDNDLPDERVPTPIPYELPPPSPPPAALVGLAKQLVSLERLGSDRYLVQFLFTLENFGETEATNLQILDDLQRAFPAPAEFSIANVRSDSLAVNEAFDGSSDQALTTGQDSLAAGASAELQLELELHSPPGARYLNSAQVQLANGGADVSTDGANPDPSDDGLPDEATPTPVIIPVALPDAETQALQIRVTPRPRVTRIGRTVGYTIEVTNAIDVDQPDVAVVDRTPTGFRPVNDQAILVRAGVDGLFDTADDERSSLPAEGFDRLVFALFPMAAREVVRIQFPSKVTSAARVGPHPNQSIANSPISTEVSDDAVVEVIADALFERATVIGKVFRDYDGDGRQNPAGGEPGVAGARLITPEGLIVETDKYGRYHIADIDADGRFGSNYLVKLDSDSLPGSALIVSDLRQVARLSAGGFAKLNFAVQWDEFEGHDPCCGEFEHLDTLGPWPPEKQLDVALQTVEGEASSSLRTLTFDVRSNYADVAPCLHLAVFESSAKAPVQTVQHRLKGTRAQLSLSLETVRSREFEYVLYAQSSDSKDQCPNLLLSGMTAPLLADATRRQMFELPTSIQRLDLGGRAEGSSLAVDRIALPALLPQRTVRRRGDDYQVVERLSIPDSRVAGRVSHGWSATEPEIVAVADLRRDTSLEAAGFRLPVQDGGESGTIVVKRDSDDFQDAVEFTARGMVAELSCCDLRSRVETRLDPNNAVYAVRFSNRHSHALEVCMAPLAQPTQDATVVAADCWKNNAAIPVAAGNSIDFFEGQFEAAAPRGAQPWIALYLLVRDPLLISAGKTPEDPRNGFLITREREGGERWTLPETTALCGAVSSEIDITRSEGVASQTIRSGPGQVVEDASEEEVFLGDDLFVGVIDLTLGGSSASGSLQLLARSQDLDDSFLGAGRLAGYWRGSRTVDWGRHLQPGAQSTLSWVLQLDSSKALLGDFGSNLARKDPRRLFRLLDADSYYPTYGDDSTSILDTDSQGAFYARVDIDDSFAGWGNYSAEFGDTEFAHFNRTLYGLNLEHQSIAKTSWGEPETTLKAFGSQAQSVSGHASFLATGGSLYYLQDTDIVLGSERVWVEVRRRGSQQVEERQALVAGRDYEVDALQGRILLNRPLQQLIRERYNPVIRSEAAQGDQVWLFVDYEYLPEGFAADEYVYGLRGSRWFKDRLRVGLTHVVDEQGAGDYELSGIDLLFRQSDGRYLAVEFAGSSAERSRAPLLSLDGGLSFEGRGFDSPGGSGGAFGLEGRWSLGEGSDNRGYVQGWYKQRNTAFSNSRLSGHSQVRDLGMEFSLALGADAQLLGGFTVLEREDFRDERTARLQYSRQWHCPQRAACWQLDLEARRDSVQSRFGDGLVNPDLGLFEQALARTREGAGTVAGLRVGRTLGQRTTLYGSAQRGLATDADYGNNDLLVLGVNQRVSDSLAVSLELSDSNRGSATTAGVDFSPGANTHFNVATGVGSGANTQFATRYQLSQSHSVYGSYTISPDRTDSAQNMLSFGQRRDLGRRTQVYSESQFGHTDQAASTGHLFGVDFGLGEHLVLATTLQASSVERSDGDYQRTAASVGLGWTADALRVSGRVEVRDDDGGQVNARQYLVSSALGLALGDSGRIQAKFNGALVDDAATALKSGRFAELSVGYAYRPTVADRLNGMLRYGYLFDVATQGQSDAVGDEKAHLLSAEGMFEVTPRLQLGAKIAGRSGKSRVAKGQGRWDELRLGLATARVLVDLSSSSKPAAKPWLPNRWELLAEYRWLRDWSGENSSKGALLGLYHQIDSRNWNSKLGNSIRLGVGYNFSGFNDGLRDNGYRAHGWFVDILTAF